VKRNYARAAVQRQASASRYRDQSTKDDAEQGAALIANTRRCLVNRQQELLAGHAPGETPLKLPWQTAAAILAAVLIVTIAYGVVELQRGKTSAASAQVQPLWFHAAVIDADSPRAEKYSGSTRLAVRLPDSSNASIAMKAGKPRALLLPPSNTLADRRERALQAGAEVDQDSSVILPTTTDQGERIDFVIHADGNTMASDPRLEAATSQR
jgi:hypothetical protein